MNSRTAHIQEQPASINFCSCKTEDVEKNFNIKSNLTQKAMAEEGILIMKELHI